MHDRGPALFWGDATLSCIMCGLLGASAGSILTALYLVLQ